MLRKIVPVLPDNVLARHSLRSVSFAVRRAGGGLQTTLASAEPAQQNEAVDKAMESADS